MKSLPQIIEIVCNSNATKTALAKIRLSVIIKTVVNKRPINAIKAVIFLNFTRSLSDNGFCGVSAGERSIDITEHTIYNVIRIPLSMNDHNLNDAMESANAVKVRVRQCASVLTWTPPANLCIAKNVA